MADHYRAAVEELDEAAELTNELTVAYGRGADRAVIGRLHFEQGDALKRAEIHATLAVAQQLADLRLPA